MSSNLPEPDQGVASGEAAEVAQARRDVEAALSSGDIDLHGLFAASDNESGSSHRVYGHVHIRAALLALPGIGEKKADEILAELGMEHDRHIDAIGAQERRAIIQGVVDRT